MKMFDLLLFLGIWFDCVQGLLAPSLISRGIINRARSRVFVQEDEVYMLQAVELAKQGLGKTAPNPAVGCVVVATNGTIIGRGFHPAAGEPHAEIFALRDAGAQLSVGENDTRWQVLDAAHLVNSTVYVTLEPCSHVGRTPPCCDVLIDIGVSRVVVGMKDPAPWVSGRGIERMRAANISVIVDIEASACEQLNFDWINNVTSR